MNRIPKFRIWSPTEELFKTSENGMIGKIGNFISPNRIELNENGELFDLYGEPVIYQQYTGLKDKNEKEIYEGDILKLTDGGLGEIIYQESGFILRCQDGREFFLYQSDCSVCYEIIGDIFENSELLK